MSVADTTTQPCDFPKLHSPFVRETNADGEYVVTDQVQDGHEWVFEEAETIQAVEKIDGTNVSVVIEDGDIDTIFTRLGDKTINEVDVFTKQYGHIVDGVQNAVRRGWFEEYNDEQVYGELIGEKVNGNPYDIDGHIFVPFDYLRDHCTYRSYGDYPTDFESIRDWFADGLVSLFYARWHNLKFEELPDDHFVEGVVFHHPETGKMSKLRRSMFASIDA